MLYPAELKTHVERVVGIEPTLPAWKAGVLPIYDTRIVGAEDEARTRDIHLGKVALYQLSYSRTFHHCMVQVKGVEPPRPKALDPKSSASANSATPAFGDSSGTRTPDTMIKSHVLYHLS